MWTNHITGTGTAIVYSSQNQEITKPQLIIGQGNMIIGELTPLSFHTFLQIQNFDLVRKGLNGKR